MPAKKITATDLINHVNKTKGLGNKKKKIIAKLIVKLEKGNKYNLGQLINFCKNNEFTNSEIKFTYKILVQKYTKNIKIDNTKILPTQNNKDASSKNKTKQIIIKYFNYIINLIKNTDTKTLLRRLLMFEISQEVYKKGAVSSRFHLFLKTLPSMIPVSEDSHWPIINNKKNFILPLQNYLLKNIVKPLKKVFTRPGHVKIESFIMKTGLNHEDYINFTANLEQKKFITTTKDEIIFIIKNINYNPDLFQESIRKNLDNMTEAEQKETARKVNNLFQKSISINPDDHILHSIYTGCKNKQYKLLVSDFHLLQNNNWDAAPPEIDFHSILTETFGLFSMYFEKHLDADHTLANYCQELTTTIVNIFCDKKRSKAEMQTEPEQKKITALSPTQCILLNQILAFAYYLPGKTFNIINRFYDSLDNKIKNVFRKQFDNFSHDIKNELP
ncbi:MAG TPA: hypothetical protein VKS21_05070 [Spirochaetota bacterium]|nr:hypothetical protein [Spirochaetota bacterium]